MSNMLNIEIRPLNIDTIKEQIKLMDVAFSVNSNMTAAYALMVHKHYENPRRLGEVGFGAFYEGRLVGMCYFITDRYIYKGTHLISFQCSDAAVHPDFQRRGLQTRIIQTAEKYFGALGVDFCWGAPNKSSYAVCMKHSYISMEQGKHVYFLLKAYVMARYIILKRTPDKRSIPILPYSETVRKGSCRGFYISLSGRPEEDCFFDNQSSEKRILLKCDQEYLNWKLCGGGCLFCVVRDNENRLAAKFILKVDTIAASVLAHTFYTDNMAVQRECVSLLIREMRKRHFGALSFWTAEASDWKLMKSCGGILFERSKSLRPRVIKVLTEDPEKKKLLSDASLWLQQRLEMDTIIDSYEEPSKKEYNNVQYNQ